MNHFDNKNKYWSVKDLAEELGVSQKKIYASCGRREIPHLRIGKTIKFHKNVVELLTVEVTEKD